MSAEVSFTKRAAAELSRCFNGITVSRPNSKGASSSSSNGSSTTGTSSHQPPASSTECNGSGGGFLKNRRNSSSQDCNGKESRSHKSITGFYNFRSGDKGSNQSTKESVTSSGTKGTGEMSIPMTPNKQRRPSRNGPPPKAPPKTNRARRRNYLLNLNKPTTLGQLFVDENFLKRFFSHVSSIERCSLTQVCKTWYQVLYGNADYWNNLTFVINYNQFAGDKCTVSGDGKLAGQPAGQQANSLNDNCSISVNQQQQSCDLDNGFSSVLLYTNGETTLANQSGQFSSLTQKWPFTSKQQSKDKTPTTSSSSTTESSSSTVALNSDLRTRFYQSINTRSFHSLRIQSATDSDLLEFATHATMLQGMDHLSHISIQHSSITDKGLEVLLASISRSLHSFELIGCNEITDSGLWIGLVPGLHSLTIQDCINVSDETIAAICQLLTSLHTLHIQAYHVTDVSMAYFSTSMLRESLRVLVLQHCWEITNQGVANMAHSLPNLTWLSLSGCSKVTDDAIEVVAEQLRQLEQLDLSWCPRISDAALEYIACDLADTLKCLVLDRCLHITDIGLGYIATMSHLEHLSVRWCPQVRDFGLQALASVRSLKTLSIAGCSHVTITGMSFIVRMQHLEEIELTNCPAASKDLVKYLCDSMPKTCTIIV